MTKDDWTLAFRTLEAVVTERVQELRKQEEQAYASLGRMVAREESKESIAERKARINVILEQVAEASGILNRLAQCWHRGPPTSEDPVV